MIRRHLLVVSAAPLVAVALVAPAGASAPRSAPATGQGCSEVAALLDAQTSFAAAYLRGDYAEVAVVIGSLPLLVVAAEATVPAELSGALDAMAAQVPALQAAIEGIAPTDSTALSSALATIPADPAAQEGFTAVLTYATTNCGYQPVDLLADPGSPAPCDALDPAVAADAAGLTIDVTDVDGTGSFVVPGFATESCSYGDGAMTISTLSFATADDAIRQWTALIGEAGADRLDPPLGELPASTIATGLGGTITIAVFEAPVPFSVAFTGGAVTPAEAVRAAAAILGAQEQPAGSVGAGSAPAGSEPNG